jgi:chromosome segregation ATPase
VRRVAHRQERFKAAELQQQLTALEAEIADSKATLGRFRAEFEQLRAALLVDRMAKAMEVTELAEQKRRVAGELSEVEAVLDTTRQRVYEEERRCVAALSSCRRARSSASRCCACLQEVGRPHSCRAGGRGAEDRPRAAAHPRED